MQTTCSAAIFASMATSPDAMKGLVSVSGPIRVMSFVVPKSPLGVCDCFGATHWNQDAEARSFGENTTSFVSTALVRVLINRDC